jgi:hypothetical protein
MLEPLRISEAILIVFDAEGNGIPGFEFVITNVGIRYFPYTFAAASALT